MRHRLITLTALCAMAIPSVASAQDAIDDWEIGAPALVTPSLSLAYSFGNHVDAYDRTNEMHGLSLYVGANLYPSTEPLVPYLGIGAEFEWTQLIDGRDATYIMPSGKLGLAWLGCFNEGDTVDYVDGTFPCATTYLLGALRPPGPYRSSAMRMGFGFNSILLTVAGAAGEILLPSGFEVYAELEESGAAAAFFRIQLGF